MEYRALSIRQHGAERSVAQAAPRLWSCLTRAAPTAAQSAYPRAPLPHYLRQYLYFCTSFCSVFALLSSGYTREQLLPETPVGEESFRVSAPELLVALPADGFVKGRARLALLPLCGATIEHALGLCGGHAWAHTRALRRLRCQLMRGTWRFSWLVGCRAERCS